MTKWRWFDRTFHFDFPPEKLPDLLERLRGTPVRCDERVRGLSRDALTGTDGAGWSIQQNIGHLIDLEDLHLRRVDEIVAGLPTLTAADTTNRRTHDAPHNERPLAELLASLRTERGRLVQRLEAVEPRDGNKSSVHPRLQQPMRIVDLAYFCAEHDDYHLARIGSLVRTFSK